MSSSIQYFLVGLLLATLLPACATVPKFPGNTKALGKGHYVRRVMPPALGQQASNSAYYYLDHSPKGFRDDCSGFVCASFDRAGVPLRGNTASIWERARDVKATHNHRRPNPGDLAFFDDTHDRNGNGKLDDDLTHIAIVLKVDDDGTIMMAHAGTSKGRSTMRMNLYQPDRHADDGGKIINSYLRGRKNSDSSKVKYLSGELFRGFASIKSENIQKWTE